MARKPKAPIITADDMTQLYALLGYPGLRTGHNPLTTHAKWNKSDAVVRYCGLAYEALHLITCGLNEMMQHVEPRDREAQMREEFHFNMIRDLVRAAGMFLGDGFPDRFWTDAVNADEEFGRRAEAARTAPQKVAHLSTTRLKRSRRRSSRPVPVSLN